MARLISPIGWLRFGAGLALVLAALLVAYALHEGWGGARSADEIRARADAEMNRIEAEADRIANEAAH